MNELEYAEMETRQMFRELDEELDSYIKDDVDKHRAKLTLRLLDKAYKAWIDKIQNSKG